MRRCILRTSILEMTAPNRPMLSTEYYHQQYLADTKNPYGYCPDHGTGVFCPVGVARPTAKRGLAVLAS